MGENVKALRTIAGLTQAQLAASSFVSREWIVKIENGRATTTENLLVIAEALRVEPEWLFYSLDQEVGWPQLLKKLAGIHRP